MSEKKPKAPQEPSNTTTKRWHSLIDSPVGHLYLAANSKALTGLWYEEQTHFPIPDELGEFIPDPSAIAANSEPAPAASILKHTTRELQEYFAGKRTTFTIPLAPEEQIFSSWYGNIYVQSPTDIPQPTEPSHMPWDQAHPRRRSDKLLGTIKFQSSSPVIAFWGPMASSPATQAGSTANSSFSTSKNLQKFARVDSFRLSTILSK